MISIIVLSIIQGIAEFLPISSSAHLIIFRDIFMIGKDIISPSIELTFDIALHIGTMLSIVTYFFKDFTSMFINGAKKKDKRLLYIIISTIPASIAGFLFEDFIDSIVRNNYILIVIALSVMGVIIYFIDSNKESRKNINSMNFKDALIVGVCQVFALIPGFSRSGCTISGLRYLKYDRETSAKYSFYLSVPIVLGALLLQIIKNNFSIISNNISIFILGVTISFVVGLLSIKFLLKYLKNNNFKIFMWYRLILSLLVIIYLILN